MAVIDTSDVVCAAVRHFCMSAAARYRHGPYRRPGGEPDAEPEITTAVEGRLYRVQLVDVDGYLVDLQIYAGLEDMGGLLWEQEMRVLLKVGTVAYPGLPEILDGGFVGADEIRTVVPGSTVGGLALVATRGAPMTAANPEVLSNVRKEPLYALRQFAVLSEALATLHDLGVCHRNLWPGTVALTDDRWPTMWLARFEMSTMIEHLLRGSSIDRHDDGSVVRHLYRSQAPRALAFAPPERWPALFDHLVAYGRYEDERADIFGLGCLVWEWFFGPMPAHLVPGPEHDDETAARMIAELHDAMRAATRARNGVPDVLAELIGTMIAASHEDRVTAAQTVEALAASYERLAVHLEGAESEQPHVLGFMPAESEQTIYRWGWITFPPGTPQGRDELRSFIEDDVRHGKLLHSPQGAEPFVRSGKPEDLRRCVHVLLGSQAVWFCRPYQPRGAFGSLGAPMDEVLLIAYVAPRDRGAVRAGLTVLTDTPFRRELPPIEAVPVDIAAEELRGRAAGRPGWGPLLETVRPTKTMSLHEQQYQTAIEWLLEYQGVELRAQTYAFTTVEAGARVGTLELDRTRDDRWLAESALLTKFAGVEGLRPDIGKAFLATEDSDDAAVELVADDGGRPSRKGPYWKAYVVEELGPDRVRIELKSTGMRLPAKGWIKRDDAGTRVALERQMVARWDLLAQPQLLAQLLRPTSFQMLPRRWKGAGATLVGEDGPKAVRAMLTFEPFFALQGPPGTGKTTVAAEAVAAYLRRYPYARVLVSAQSNYALDNLAIRVLGKLGAVTADGRPSGRWDGVALRVASRLADVDENMKEWQWEPLAARRLDEIRRTVGDGMTDPAHGPCTSAVLAEWNDALTGDEGDSVLPELAERTRRGASLVFATCSMATAENVTPDGVRGTMDWVVVEEAAKAWPTELAVPLTRGRRWTLIGDHQQLPAHRRESIDRFLRSCLDDPDADLAVVAQHRDAYLRVFDLFGSFFADEPRTPSGTAAVTRMHRPLKTLQTQFRMRAPIAEVVSRVFYPSADARYPDGLRPGKLRSGREVEAAEIERPGWLAGADLVWLDTAGVPGCSDEPLWRNPGEAEIVNELVSGLRPKCVTPGDTGGAAALAVLSPYRRQNHILAGYSDVKGHLSTVHAFQGREADIVVVSLVRDTVRGPRDVVSPTASLGHLTSPNLVNVLLSRARRLLVLVGRFDHYAGFASEAKHDEDRPSGAFWGDICRAVEIYGRRVPAAQHFDGKR